MFNKKQGGNTVQKVWELAKPIAENLGLDLWDIRFIKEGAGWYLRIFIDSPSGISVEDCEKMSKAIDKPLDELDPIEQSYCLEVSSPGIERELIHPEHFERFKGHEVIVKLIRPLENGIREFVGILEEAKNNEVYIRPENSEQIKIPKKDTVFIKLNDFKQ